MLDSATISCRGAKLYRELGGAIGRSIHWEQRHLLTHIGESDLVEYRKRQARRQSLANIASQWGLMETSWRPASSGPAPTVTIDSSLLGPWLLSTVVRRGPPPSPCKVVKVGRLLRSLADAAEQGIKLFPRVPPLEVQNSAGRKLAEIPTISGAQIGADMDFRSFLPRVENVWQQVSEVVHDGWELRSIDRATFFDWLIVAHIAAKHDWMPAPLCTSIARNANKILGTGLELWLLVVYVANITGRESVACIMAKSGRQQIRRDSFAKAIAMLRAEQSHGHGSGFLHGSLGDPGMDSVLSRAACTCYLAELEKHFATVKRMSWAWDPGTYGGVSFSVGLCHSIDNDRAAALPIMVTR